MDKDIKNEFKKLTEILGEKIDGNAKNIAKLSKKVEKISKKINDELPTAEMINNSFASTANDLENLEKKMDAGFEKINKKFKDLEKDVDDISANLQIQKNVPIIRKINEKVNKHIEIHEKRGNITKEDIAVINKINPFPSKEALAQ